MSRSILFLLISVPNYFLIEDYNTTMTLTFFFALCYLGTGIVIMLNGMEKVKIDKDLYILELTELITIGICILYYPMFIYRHDTEDFTELN